MGERSLWRQLGIFREGGAAALFDKRKIRQAVTDVYALPEEYVEAARRVTRELEGLSAKPRKQQVAAVRHLVEEDCARREVPAPEAPEYRIRRILRELEEAAGTHLSTKSRNSKASRSERRGRGFDADALGEQVVIDTWPLDVMVIDDDTGESIRVVAVIALDVHTRAILAGDLYVTSELGVDIALLLHEMLLPRQWDPAWGPETRWFYAGIPKEMLVLYGEAWGYPVDEPSSHVPTVPSSLTVDQGTVYLSQPVMNVCHALGTTIRPARKRTGSDKGPVERLFGTINSEFLTWYASHRGRHVGERGAKLNEVPPVPFSQLRTAFRSYLMTEYPNTPRDGLRLPANPSKCLTPNQAVELALQRQGLVLAVPDPSLIIDLLPPHLRVITNSGVSVGNLNYWGDVMDELRSMQSPYVGKAAGRFVVAVHPLDPLRGFIFHPWEKAWYPMEAFNVRQPGEPMASATDEWVRNQLMGGSTDWQAAEAAREARFERRSSEQIEATYTPAGKRKARRDTARAKADRERKEKLVEALLEDGVPAEKATDEAAPSPGDPVGAASSEAEEDFPIIGAASYRPSVLNVGMYPEDLDSDEDEEES